MKPTGTTVPAGDEEVTFHSATATLAGTLHLPAAPGKVPAVLLLPGSGPLDRDANHKRGRFDTSRQFARALGTAGIASLRFDKRGVGSSPGDWREAGLLDNIADAGAAVDMLCRQPGIDTSRVFVLGHSEGALIAAAVAADRPQLRGVVLLSAAAQDGQSVLLWQVDNVKASLPRFVGGLLRLLRVDLAAKVRANHQKLLATTTDVARIGGQKVNARWFREFMRHQPTDDLARLTMPTLAITGGKDLQVNADDLEIVRRTVPAPVTIHRPPDITHTLRHQPGPASLRLYRQELKRPVAPEVIDLVTEWIRTAPQPS